MLPTDRELWELLLKVIRVDSPPSIIGDLLQKMPNYLQVLETSLDNGPTTSTDSKVPQHEQQPTLRGEVGLLTFTFNMFVKPLVIVLVNN